MTLVSALKSLRNRSALIALKCLFAAALVCVFPVAGGAAGNEIVTLIKDTDVTLTGNFQKDGKVAVPDWFDPSNRGPVMFGSYGQPSIDKGSLTTAPFRVPARLEMYVSGFPRHQGTRIYLQDEEIPSRTLDLITEIEPVNYWRLRVWDMPDEWRGIRAHMIVEDNAPGDGNTWIGVTLPAAAHTSYLYLLFRAGWRAVLVTLAGILFLIPGLAVALTLNRWLALKAPRFLILAFAASGVVGYAVFWAYFSSPVCGRFFAIGAMIAGFCVTVWSAWQSRRTGASILPREALTALAAVTIAAVLYSSLGFLYLWDDNAGISMQHRFFSAALPPDNVLPELVAIRLMRGESLRKPLVAEWQTSDRPPLQTGLVLLEMPFWAAFNFDLLYELISMFLQCSWVAAVWVLLRSAGIGYKRIVPTMALCILSEFCFFHSAFVWPKMLAAGFFIMGFSMFVTPEGFSFKLLRWEWILSGVCFALAMLSHSGVAFTMVGMFIVFAFHWRSIDKVGLLSGVGYLALLIVPWVMFQKFYDPPGDQLLKLSFTGATNHDLSLGQALAKAYHGMTVSEFFNRRWEDLKILFYTDSKHLVPAQTNRETLDNILNEQFFSFFFALGFLNLGLLLRLFRRRSELKSSFKLADQLAIMVGISLPFWILAMSEARATIIHQGSLASLLLVFVACGLYLSAYFPRGVYLVLLLQTVFVFPLLVFARPTLYVGPYSVLDVVMDPGMLSIAIVAFCALVYLGCRTARMEEAH